MKNEPLFLHKLKSIVKEHDFSAEVSWYLITNYAQNNIQMPINEK